MKSLKKLEEYAIKRFTISDRRKKVYFESKSRRIKLSALLFNIGSGSSVDVSLKNNTLTKDKDNRIMK